MLSFQTSKVVVGEEEREERKGQMLAWIFMSVERIEAGE